MREGCANAIGRILTTATALVVIAAATVTAEAKLKREPREGHLLPGQRLLVDDGTCPRGQIKEVVGGNNRIYQTATKKIGAPRTTNCIAR